MGNALQQIVKQIKLCENKRGCALEEAAIVSVAWSLFESTKSTSNIEAKRISLYPGGRGMLGVDIGDLLKFSTMFVFFIFFAGTVTSICLQFISFRFIPLFPCGSRVMLPLLYHLFQGGAGVTGAKSSDSMGTPWTSRQLIAGLCLQLLLLFSNVYFCFSCLSSFLYFICMAPIQNKSNFETPSKLNARPSLPDL